jgi:SAM-dependent methyltransferase
VNNNFPSVLQENEYAFPYHHIPRYDGKTLQHSLYFAWACEYLTYLDAVLARIRSLPFDSLLDVGCGDGRLLSDLNRLIPGRRYCGIDTSERAIAFARLFVGCDVSLVHGNIVTAELGQYNVLTLVEVLEHIPPQENGDFVKALWRKSQPNAMLLVTVPSCRDAVTSKHYQHFDRDKLESVLLPYFRSQDICYLNQIGPTRMITKLMANRVFSLNLSWALRQVYRIYSQKFVKANCANGMRLLGLFQRQELDTDYANA